MINFDARLSRMKDRRQGTREIALLKAQAQNSTASPYLDYRQAEPYEALTESAAVKYAVGAMAEVAPDSTRISIEVGERVAKTLGDMLETRGLNNVSRLQGSVPLNIHIEGHSDVDVLVIMTKTVLIETPMEGSYQPASDTRPIEDQLKELRENSEQCLKSRYHQSEVDCTNNKSIAIKSPSLARKVDIVPSCWYDSLEYQRQPHESHLRGVHIYHKGDHKTIGNQPFKHIKMVTDKDNIYSGNLKRVARLLKNLLQDMPEGKHRVAKALTSYDLAGIAYHMDELLNVSKVFSLALVATTRAYLEYLLANDDIRNNLSVPDGSRKIFNDENKTAALNVFSEEVGALAFAIYKELEPLGSTYNPRILINKRIEI